MADKLCGVDVPTCDTLEAGGLPVTTHARRRIQKVAEKWVKAAAVVPNRRSPSGAPRSWG